MERRLAAFAPPTGEARLSEKVMSQANLLTHDFDRQQLALDLRVAPYALAFESIRDGAFFRTEREAGRRRLLINTAHRFYEDVYSAPAVTDEVRASLEILLFTFGDTVLDGADSPSAAAMRDVASWSRRLELALGMVANHLADSDDTDVGPLSWGSDLG
jgi:hypothetical protein